MPGLVDLLTEQEETSECVDEQDEPEEDDLYLPSSFSAADRQRYALTKLAERELEMRYHYAEGELQQVKHTIRVYDIDTDKKKQVSGTAANTRAQAKLKKDIKKRDKHMRRYNLHFDAMVSLGYDTKDRRYQKLDRESLQSSKNMKKPATLGSGKAKAGDQWFWREGKDVSRVNSITDEELSAMNDEEQRVRYFRLWANWKRWDEEWLILGAELDRTVRHFAKMQEVWSYLAEAALEDVRIARQGVEDRWVSLQRNSGSRILDRSVKLPMETERKVREAQGKRAYAFKKAAFFSMLMDEAKDVRQEAGKKDNGRGWDGWKPRVRDDDVVHPPAKKTRVE